jgi:hypothetical protein
MEQWHLFWLGVAAGISILACTAYRTVSPRWLRRLLFLAGLLTISRYLAMALFAIHTDPKPSWLWKRCWFATSLGVTLPSIVALDQLIRHPAMSPRKLLQWYSPFLMAYGAVLLWGNFQLAYDPLLGASVRLVGWGRWLLALAHGVFVVGFVLLGGMVVRAIRSWNIRLAVLGLMLAQGYLGLDGLLVGFGLWYFRPFVFSEILALGAIWFALETARTNPL